MAFGEFEDRYESCFNKGHVLEIGRSAGFPFLGEALNFAQIKTLAALFESLREAQSALEERIDEFFG